MNSTAASERFGGSLVHGDDGVVVMVRGEVDMAVIAAFRALLDEAVEASPHVTIDMGDVTFLDSTGLRALSVTRMRVGSGGSVRIRNAAPSILKLLRVSGMDTIVTIEPVAAAS